MADETTGTTGTTRTKSTKAAAKAEAEDARKSSDARFSTYRPATDDELDLADPVLPPGPHVMQEKGEASEDADPGFKFANKQR